VKVLVTLLEHIDHVKFAAFIILCMVVCFECFRLVL